MKKEEKLQFFLRRLRDDAIDFWQMLGISRNKTLQGVLTKIRKKNTQEALEEVSRYKRDQLKCDPQAETFNAFLKKLIHIGKQTFGLKTNEILSAFMCGKLPTKLQQDLSTAGKMDATTD